MVKWPLATPYCTFARASPTASLSSAHQCSDRSHRCKVNCGNPLTHRASSIFQSPVRHLAGSLSEGTEVRPTVQRPRRHLCRRLPHAYTSHVPYPRLVWSIGSDLNTSWAFYNWSNTEPIRDPWCQWLVAGYGKISWFGCFTDALVLWAVSVNIGYIRNDIGTSASIVATRLLPWLGKCEGGDVDGDQDLRRDQYNTAWVRDGTAHTMPLPILK
jgi:hypothetical protein